MAQSPAPAAVPAETLLLETSINGRSLPDIVLAELGADGRLVLPSSVLVEARLRLGDTTEAMADGQPGTALESLPGLHYEIDRARQLLVVDAPASAFLGNAVSLAEAALAAQAPASPGAYLDYDLYAGTADGRGDYGGLLEGVVFNGWGALVSGVAIRDGKTGDGVFRTETFFRKDLPGRMEAVVVGDAISSSGAWSRPVRFGGVRYARDFGLAPGYVTYPLPAVNGAAALPSTIDILVNNQRRGAAEVPTGPFELTDIPIVNGAGEIQLVVHDLLGRQTVITQGYYATPALLRPGLSDFSYEAGRLREGFGTPEDHYGDSFVSGTYRRGLTATITGEVRGEYQADRTAAGLSVSTLVGNFGVVGVAAAFSETAGQGGAHYLASFQHAGPRGGLGVSWSRFDEGFQQLGAIQAESRPRQEIGASAGIRLGSQVTLGATFNRRTTWDGDEFSIAGINMGVELPGNATLSLHASRTLVDQSDWSAGLSVVVPLENRRAASVHSTRGYDGQVSTRLQAEQAAPTGPGFGWRIGAEHAESTRLLASAVLNSEYGQATVDADHAGGSTAVRLGANGSVGWLGGLPFAAGRIGQGAFAVVKVGDLPGVEVSLSNQVVAVTNRKGLALVPGLLPYQANALTIDPDALPMDVEIGGVREQRQPHARSGVLVEFPVRRSHDLLFTLWQAEGEPLPIGARLTLSPSGREFVVARRGEAYLTGLPAAGRIALHWKGGNCRLSVDLDRLPPVNQTARVPRTMTCGEKP